MTPKDIARNAYVPLTSLGGPPATVRGMAKMFVQRGNEVTVLTADRGLENNHVVNGVGNRKKKSTSAGNH